MSKGNMVVTDKNGMPYYKEFVDIVEVHANKGPGTHYKREYDLCPDCAARLMSWLNRSGGLDG